ncbi:threonylcarbamoyladenosine tRNA methylthiotransferase MtaB [Halanaerobium saccharolyticum]|uniref:Threonylcarbamoyladenosine tRNA methylthiotransferase MtaB n=2 Tax=Halanaerobium saccharolyticum TaxID=43595 RepID=A0A4R7Z4T4_9FIRM|nr:threonylcarbamoyladenosine tRNA methylthiotransferase MtaB [Halanaerobium saccharolyticum]TDW05283.1 threonylcarbamoyladenosine tRNA methylthiotransferase MtaB [Halanaerobium saccharolyticum]TDX60353.1 threonylcarbamoyladenosine tRNA methylthiotransferase MtaB [Halanaerobium saccharolyticum]
MIKMIKKAAFYTLGCKVNQYETEAVIDIFIDHGYQIVDFSDKADVYIVNSCTVTNEAARKTRQIARRAKRSSPESIVAIVGCYTQAFPDEVSEIEEIDFVMGSNNKAEILKKAEEMLAGKTIKNEVKEYSQLSEYEDLELKRLSNTTRANVKIEDGCNQFCSYCIIPYARGPVRSRREKDVVAEIRRLSQQGVKEIILTGTHLGAYGSEQGNSEALTRLMKSLTEIEELKRVRLSSIEGTEIDQGMLELIAEEDIFCPHLHLPLQSGSDQILKAMQRPYSVAEFKDTVAELREKIPDLAITTDVIVGFPGETEATFEQTLEVVKEIGFAKVHVFPYSAREGTPAAEMEQLNGNLVKEYSKKLRLVNEALMLDYQKKFIGQEKEVLIEEVRDHKTDLLTGYTDNYLKVLLSGSDKLKNQLVNVKLEKSVDPYHLKGKIVN